VQNKKIRDDVPRTLSVKPKGILCSLGAGPEVLLHSDMVRLLGDTFMIVTSPMFVRGRPTENWYRYKARHQEPMVAPASVLVSSCAGCNGKLVVNIGMRSGETGSPMRECAANTFGIGHDGCQDTLVAPDRVRLAVVGSKRGLARRGVHFHPLYSPRSQRYALVKLAQRPVGCPLLHLA
jgi:hypothetical protein